MSGGDTDFARVEDDKDDTEDAGDIMVVGVWDREFDGVIVVVVRMDGVFVGVVHMLPPYLIAGTACVCVNVGVG